MALAGVDPSVRSAAAAADARCRRYRSASMLGAERYRYPANLPKVGGDRRPAMPATFPSCPSMWRPPYVVADIGANPWQYGNPQLLINSDALKQLLYGPLDGPPRNTAQIGQPG